MRRDIFGGEMTKFGFPLAFWGKMRYNVNKTAVR